jgi:toxin YoeB
VKIIFQPRALDDYLAWQADRRMLDRVNALIQDTARSPFKGIGKPEPLRDNWAGWWAGWWSRRIDGEHRLIYRVSGKGDEQRLEIAQCRYHY